MSWSLVKFPVGLFLLLFCTGIFATFFLADKVSVTTETESEMMISPFPVALIDSQGVAQVVSEEQLQRLQLPDPTSQQRLIPAYRFADHYFIDGRMADQSIAGEFVSNGHDINIPSVYSAQVVAKQVADGGQEVVIVYKPKAKDEKIITSVYLVQGDTYHRLSQSVKVIMIWKAIFMNGMAISLIGSFVFCKRKAGRANGDVSAQILG